MQTLEEFMKESLEDGIIYRVGVVSAFFFIGTADQFFEDKEAIEKTRDIMIRQSIVRARQAIARESEKLAEMFRSEWIFNKGITDMIVILEGIENGQFWTIAEYEDAMKYRRK